MHLRIALDNFIEFISLSHEFALQVFNFTSQLTFSQFLSDSTQLNFYSQFLKFLSTPLHK